MKGRLSESPRGTMTVAQFEEWLDTHPPLPQADHVFMEPCGQMEGRNSCWYCGKPRSWHPEPEPEE